MIQADYELRNCDFLYFDYFDLMQDEVKSTY